MEKHLMNLKIAAKQLNKLSVKCDKAEKLEKKKVKMAMQKGNMEGARIHAENAIREKSQSLNFLRMGARLDGVTQRIQTAVTMQQVTKSMKGVVQGMDRAMASMNLVQLTQMMDKFEQQQEALDVQTQVMDGAMSATTAQTMPEGQVNELMQQVADEHGLEVGEELDASSAGPIGSTTVAEEEQDILAERLKQIRSTMS